MCSDDAPSAPTPDPAIAQAAARQAELGQQYLDFAKEQFAVSRGMQEDMNAVAKEATDTFMGMAKEDRDRWQTVFKPLEDQFVQQAQDFDSPARQAEAASKAKADVMTAAAAERGAATRSMQAAGVNPASGRYQGIERAMGLGTTLGSVDAQNRARQDVRNTGLALKGQAIGLGRNLAGQTASELSGAVATATQPISTHAASTSIMQPAYSGAMTGLNNQATALTGLYKGALDAWGTEMKYDAANAQGMGQFAGKALGALSSPGFGSSAIGLGLSFLSSKKAKENRKAVPEGESLQAVEKMPVETYDYKPGMGDGGSHVGPMAEDFAKTTGKGDGTKIAVQDAIGVAMGAIKDLSSKVNRIADAIGLGRHAQPKLATA